MNRRRFLVSGGALAAGLGGLPLWLARAASALAAPKRSLVVVFLRGAADGLDILPPLGDARYGALRPSIGVGPKEASDLGGGFGLHPALAPLLPHFRNGELGFIHAAGSHAGTRSHFDAQDFMETGSGGGRMLEAGWMNRALERGHAWRSGPLAAVSVTQRLPRSLRGPIPAMAFTDADQVRTAGARAASFEELYDEAVDALLAGAAHDLKGAAKLLDGVAPKEKGAAEAAGYPKGGLGRDLFELGRLLKAGVGVRLGFVEAGGWDTHADQKGRLTQRLTELGGALAAFHRDLGPAAADTVVVVMTEFGRTVQENGNRGTDHGHGGVMLLLGAGVRGGRVHGRWPGLAEDALYEGRDLAVTTDYRQALTEALRGPMGLADLAGVFPGFKSGPATGAFS
jgi:uncharacterized protein (DUF1501 family)